ncbi:multi antimicrobial extrusion protein MatE [Ammoniphilus sp. 3BR4]|uniref:multi antimicrobial extrusion protein MatE n=1 Tax=Ammoniphilus sp. 3BR4 TaxID=3158265 RepID=UPI0034650E1A
MISSLDYKTLFRFFVPLSFSATLVTLSHVIIHSTLARAENAAVVIASYSVAFSLFGVLERSAVIFRQTSTALVRDKISFYAMAKVTAMVLIAILCISLGIAFTDVGKWIFTYAFGVKEELLIPTIEAYKVLLFVTIFSGIRCFYQGVIISHLRTKWMTIMMIVRLVLMALIAVVVTKKGWATDGYIGSYIFLFGMMVEALVGFLEGHYLFKKLPEKKKEHAIESHAQVFRFYRPLLLASLIAVMINPIIMAALGWSEKGELAIASFAVAASVTQLFLSFTSYMHQIAINFFNKDPKTVIRFSIVLGLLPSLMLGCIAYTALGEWILRDIIGVTGNLLQESIVTLKFFILLTMLFPFLDFLNGMLILRNRTSFMFLSQICNVLTTIIMLSCILLFSSKSGGWIGTVSQVTGMAVEFFVVLGFILHDIKKEKIEEGSFLESHSNSF